MILGLGVLSLSAAWLLWVVKKTPRRKRNRPNGENHQCPGSWLESYRNWLERRLQSAGIRKTDAGAFLKRQVRMVLFVATISLIFLVWLSPPPWFLIVLPLIFFVLPLIRLHRQIAQRKEAILSVLPYFLDLLTLALEAGLDLVAALEEIQIKAEKDPLTEELEEVTHEIRMGQTRADAFRRLAERTDLEPLALVSSAIHQSEELGVSLGRMLRLQSQSLRQEIFRQAEEKAQKAPLKLLFPLLFLIFPVVLILLFSPILVRMAAIF